MQADDYIDDILNDERKIAKSGVRNIFTPHTPITKANYLKGRDKELSNLFSHLMTPGQHALIYGERGIGKSSLAEIASLKLCEKMGLRRFIKRCSKSDNFVTIFEEPLMCQNVDVKTISKGESSKLSLNLGKVGASKDKSKSLLGDEHLASNPSYVADIIADVEGLLVIDEFDAIQDDDDKFKIAEVMKLLSDKKANFKILIVGIAESAKELTVGHPSVSRCLREIKVPRMKIPALSEILKTGFSALNFTPNRVIIPKIVIASSGYPYFTHLLGLKISETLILEDRTNITINDLENATTKAIDDAEEFLRDMFEKSVDRFNREKYERFLLCASACRAEGFTNAELRRKYHTMFNQEVSSSSITSYLQKLSDDTGNKILRRTSRTYHRFSDPRMGSFVRIHKAYFPEVED